VTHHRSVSVNGLDIFYREDGDPGRPVLLLLHGFPAAHIRRFARTIEPPPA
jgi:pimeloyl-ACP methyl ester carboxylesterase